MFTFKVEPLTCETPRRARLRCEIKVRVTSSRTNPHADDGCDCKRRADHPIRADLRVNKSISCQWATEVASFQRVLTSPSAGRILESRQNERVLNDNHRGSRALPVGRQVRVFDPLRPVVTGSPLGARQTGRTAHVRRDSGGPTRFDVRSDKRSGGRQSGMDSARRHLVFLTCLAVLGPAFAQDILGCGGFLKSHADIDFTKVHVRL